MAANIAKSSKVFIKEKATRSGLDQKGSKARRARVHVAIATANKTGDPIAVTYDKLSLRMSDVSLLEGPRSINEAIISFYFCYLENERYKNSDMAFVAPDTANSLVELDADEMEPSIQALGLDEKPFIFFVFGDKEHNPNKSNSALTHFTLIVFSRPDKTFYYYDSCSGSGKMPSKITQQFIQELSSVLNIKVWTLKPVRGCTLLQAPYDCGIRVLCMSEKIADYINRFECVEGVGQEIRLAQDTVSAKRSEMLKLIYTLGGKITV